MRSNYPKTLKTAVVAVTLLLLGACLAAAQQVNLTAGPTAVTLPDGNTVQMWGYSCDNAGAGGATCAALNPGAAVGTWSPVVITVPVAASGSTSLAIQLTNNLPPAVAETSLVIVGQLGGGLGDVTQRTTQLSPDHSNSQQITWPIPAPGAANTPPAQGNRVQSFATPATHTGAVTLNWSNLKPGTYLIESGTYPSIQGPMGLYGMLVVTAAPTSAGAGTAYPAVGTTAAVTYSAEIPLLLSEIDPVQNNTVSAAVNTTGFTEQAVWNGQIGGCGNPKSTTYLTCYPPAVNYVPLYYMINGVAFSRNSAAASVFPVTTGTVTGSTVTGNVLVRIVNAGLRMHVPSIVGSQYTSSGATPVTSNGFALIAEDGNPLPGVPRVQSEVFMAAGKTYDVMINAPACTPVSPATTCPTNAPLPIYDRELSLSGNSTARDAGMLAYIGVNGATLPTTGVFAGASPTANPDNYFLVAGNTLTVSDLSKGVIANDINVYGVQLLGAPSGGTVTLNSNGTFSYIPNSGTTSDSFTYCANGSVTGTTCSSGVTATVTLAACSGTPCLEAGSGITMNPITYTAKIATHLAIAPPGILSVDSDAAGHPLTVNAASVSASGFTLSVDPNGGFVADVPGPGTYTFSYKAQNSQNTVSSASATVTLIFPTASNLAVTVYDPITKVPVTDYRWVIEEDRTFYVDPTNTTNTCPQGSTCPIVPTFGTNFHTSYMPLVATGCTGPLSCESGQTVLGQPAVCDIGNGVCRTTAAQETQVDPSQVSLDPKKRYYISVLPGDAANPFIAANVSAPFCTTKVVGGVTVIDTSNPGCGHGMGGAPIGIDPNTHLQQTAVTILTQPSPYPPSKLSVFVFEDDFPLNGEQDGGGGIDVLSPNEPGLGGFNITLFDDAGGPGDATGQMTYDMFNMPLSNSLAGTIDPATGLDACPIGANGVAAEQTGAILDPVTNKPIVGTLGITGTIVTCPKYEADGSTLSPLAGQAVVANLMPGRYGVVATPAADRIGRGEEWLQTNTLDGQKAHDSFLRIGEPSFFQEFGPAGYHVSIGFANPGIINARKQFVCNGTDPNSPQPGTPYTCNNTITGMATTERMSRTPDERLFSSGDNSSFGFTQCYVSFGDPDAEDFAFTKCNADGSFTLTGLPQGDWRITVFDQWNDMLVDGLSTPVRLGGGKTTDLGQIAMNQWQSNIYTKTFFDLNQNGIQDAGEDGLTLVATNNRFRDGSYSNFNNTDLAGNAGFNEIFPLFSWYVIETDTTRYKSTGAHVVYDAGGPSDGTTCGGTTGIVCGSSNIGNAMANTAEQIPVPAALRVPGARYCASADCPAGDTAGGSTGRVDPPTPFGSYGWQGFSGQNNFIEFGKKPFAPTENGGIHGEVIYASTRPFDDPGLLIHTSWTPDVPGVTINLYQEGTAADGTTSLTLVDHTTTTSWDDWAQGFRSDGNPNMNCPGQGTATGTNADLFFFTLFNQPMWLDVYNNGGTPAHTVPNNSQFKCFDGMHNWNQVQPAPYDGYYTFPSVTSIDLTTGRPNGTNCTACVANPTVATSNIPNDPNLDPYRAGTPMLPPGKYVVEMIVPPGYELVKEEDKNILIGDNYIAPVTQQFAGLGNVFILPDQAEVAASTASGCTLNTTTGYACNPQNGTQSLGRTTLPSHEGDTGSVESFWPCVGASRVVPDFISLFPQSGEASPFAGATRNLCDRKEVTLTPQESVLAKFWIFTSAHVAAHFTGVITDDFTSEFDPFSPQFGEKFSPPNLPVSLKDWSGTEVSRVYSDQWGTYNGLTYSTWEVNPPNPTGYAPTMMVVCMNDPGPILDTRAGSPTNGQMITDPLFNPQYSQFCYEIPFMPGQTQYMDTPVVPTSAFAGAGYNNPDCAYPDATPAVSEVSGDGGGAHPGPWASAQGVTLTIKALGDQQVPNNAYAGPSATAAPFNAKTVLRHYGFGTQCTAPAAGNATCNTMSSVTIGGVTATVTSWSDAQIQVTVPSLGGTSGIPLCRMQQQQQYSGLTGIPARTYCGQLLITAGNGKQSVDSVTVTVGGKRPTYVSGNVPMSPTGVGSIQQAIDGAKPGDLIIVPPGTYYEMLQMWKPVRLQGVGAASSIVNANSHPAGKINLWRTRIDCLIGLDVNGSPTTYNPACGTGWTAFQPTSINPQVDRLPLEAAVGWDATLNGNLAELLQEPSLMGALEGAAITVLGKGVNFPTTPWDTTLAAGFPTGTTLLTTDSLSCGSGDGSTSPNPFPSSFWCNPSSIDGLGITNSSQGGGGVFVHGWGHNLQIANNRITSNAGTLSGGINVGQGEFPPSYTGGAGALNAPPGSCETSSVTGLQLPYCFDMNVNVHNNYITDNSSTGDELFSATPAGAGAVSFCTGSDYYAFDYNWVCGNLSTGDGGGIGQLGFVYHHANNLTEGIRHNTIIFNQSTNPTIAANGGGILVMGTPDVDPLCGLTTDQDCVPAVGTVGPSDGIGPGLVIDANLVMGNAAEAGSGGGIRLQNLNGADVVTFPTSPNRWWDLTLTNNVIVNNVAGWDGAGISLQDALNVNIINNTVMSNDTTASSGVLFNTLGAPLASSGGPICTSNCGTTSAPQPAGLVSIQNSSVLEANLPATIICPTGHGPGGTGTGGLTNGACRKASYPVLYNDVFFQNRSFYIGVGALGTGTLNQQNVVALYNAFTTTQAPSQTATGGCPAASYWDIGVRGDTGPGDHSSTVTLSPEASLITSVAGYAGGGAGFRVNTNSNPGVVSQYCNGSRWPPEFKSAGYQVPPGISDATVPNPIFNLTPAATVDEGNNWINISWGPLALTNPVTNVVLGKYAPGSGTSPVVNYITPSNSPLTYLAAPTTDFFGTLRKANNAVDIGAIEFTGAAAAAPTLTSISPANHTRGGASFTVTLTGTNLTGATAVTVTRPAGGAVGITVSAVTPVDANTVTATFTISGTANRSARNVTVTTPGGTSNAVTFTIVPPVLSSIAPNTGARGAVVPVTLTGSGFTGATGLNVSGGGAGAIGVSAFTVVSDTQITATFTIPNAATLGPHNVAVVLPADTTGNVTFTVTGGIAFSGPTPALTTGTANTTTKTGLVTITNYLGASGSITLTPAPTVVKVGTAGGTFTVIAGGTCANNTVLAAPGGSCTVNVQYAPGTSTATATAHVQVTGTGFTSPVNGPNFNGN
jgi:hypothetical protein